MSFLDSLIKNPTSLLDSIIARWGFKYLQKLLELYFGKCVEDKNMANNFVALFHATGSTALCLSTLFLEEKNKNLYYFLIKFSTGFFLYDIEHCIKYIKSKKTYVYVYHHIISLYMLYYGPNDSIKILGLGELSNIPSYFSYYLLKNNHNKTVLKYVTKIQLILYSIIRIPLFSYIYYKNLKSGENKLFNVLILPLYFMGIYWSKILKSQL